MPTLMFDQPAPVTVRHQSTGWTFEYRVPGCSGYQMGRLEADGWTLAGVLCAVELFASGLGMALPEPATRLVEAAA